MFSLKNIALIAAPPFAALLLFQAGCDQISQERSARALEEAGEKEREGDFPAAIALYEKAQDGTGQTAEIHYTLGLIYLDKLKDPIGALFHLRRYIELDPGAAHAADARKLIAEARLPLISSLSQGAVVSQTESARLKNENLALQKALSETRALLHLQAQRSSSPPAGSGPAPAPPGSVTYTVQPGDTIASIARKFYKDPARVRDIEDANAAALAGTAHIKAGQVLIIPQ